MEANNQSFLFIPCEASLWVFHHKKPRIHLLFSCPLGRAWKNTESNLDEKIIGYNLLVIFKISAHEVCVCVCEHVPSLVEVNEKHNIISETGQSVRCWHGDDEGEDIIDEGIECLGMINYYQLIFFKKKSSSCFVNL